MTIVGCIRPFYVFLFIILLSCSEKKPLADDLAVGLYKQSKELILQMNMDSALIVLEHAMEQGYSHPMAIVQDPAFYPLIDNPTYRESIRNLLGKAAREDHSYMVRYDEPGEQIMVQGIIRDEETRLPLNNVHIELVQADQNGLYFEEKSLWNPRLFAYLKSNANGGFRINTIRPGIYQDDNGADVPAHIHFTLRIEGYRPYASEFTFEDDPTYMNTGQSDVPVAKLSSAKGIPRYQITILMQKE